MFAARRPPALGLARVGAAAVWTSRTLKAEWAARYGHTTVVDVSGAIYVIGGFGVDGTYFADVWVSTDGGARAGLGRGVVGGCPGWVPQGTTGGTTGY